MGSAIGHCCFHANSVKQLQAIASVVAMSLLDSSTCIEHLQDIDTVAKSYDSEDAPYITNTATIQK